MVFRKALMEETGVGVFVFCFFSFGGEDRAQNGLMKKDEYRGGGELDDWRRWEMERKSR